MTGKISDERLWSWVDRDAPELAGHLERHPEDRPRAAEIRAAIRGVARASSTTGVPERIGSYRILGVLGEGGMGVVYEAEQESPRRRVALKIIRPAQAEDERHVQLFRREVQALARLSHPAIATIHEAGRTETGEHFFAMELVQGRPLDRWVREEKPFRGARIELLRRIAEAVEHAHAQGVIHRDLKPSNILVDADGRPKILDFGLARLTDGELGLSLVATRSGSVLGTLPYMSPEQVLGRLDQVDARSDVYALGVLLYELLCDRLPYDLPSASLPEAARIICEVAPRRLRRVDRYLRGDLETITLKALEKAPARRYASAMALVEDLRRFQSGAPIHAVPPTLGYRLRKLLWRHKLLTASTTVVLILSAWITIVPPVDFYRRISGDDFPHISPFEDVRWKRSSGWRGTVPLVQVEGHWYELLRIEDLNAQLVVEYCKQTEGRGFMKRFCEDLPEVLHRLGSRTYRRVDLELLDLETGAVVVRENVGMTSENRRRTYHRRYRSPWPEARWVDDRLRVRLEESWYEVLSLGGLDLAQWRREAGWTRAGLRRDGVDPDGDFDEPFTEVATRVLGETPLDTIAAELRDLETGRVVHVPALPLDHESGAPALLRPLVADEEGR